MTGCIDPERLGLGPWTCAVFGGHVKGRTVPEIAGDYGTTGESVRATIVSVWRADKSSFHHSRRIAREEVEE